MTKTKIKEPNDIEEAAQKINPAELPPADIKNENEAGEPDIDKKNSDNSNAVFEEDKKTETEKEKLARIIAKALESQKENLPKKINDFFVANADEIGNVCAAIPFLSVMIIVLATMIPSSASIVRLLVILIAAFVGIIAIILLYKTSEGTAKKNKNKKTDEGNEEKKRLEVRDTSLYIISKWSVQTLKAVGVPEDLTGYLEHLLSKEESVRERGGKLAVNPEVTAEGIDKPDQWIRKLYQRFGETRVDEYIDPILKYTRRENPKKELSVKQPVEAEIGVS